MKLVISISSMLFFGLKACEAQTPSRMDSAGTFLRSSVVMSGAGSAVVSVVMHQRSREREFGWNLYEARVLDQGRPQCSVVLSELKQRPHEKAQGERLEFSYGVPAIVPPKGWQARTITVPSALLDKGCEAVLHSADDSNGRVNPTKLQIPLQVGHFDQMTDEIYEARTGPLSAAVHFEYVRDYDAYVIRVLTKTEIEGAVEVTWPLVAECSGERSQARLRRIGMQSLSSVGRHKLKSGQWVVLAAALISEPQQVDSTENRRCRVRVVVSLERERSPPTILEIDEDLERSPSVSSSDVLWQGCPDCPA